MEDLWLCLFNGRDSRGVTLDRPLERGRSNETGKDDRIIEDGCV